MTEPHGGGRCYQVVAPIGQGGFGTVYRAELLGGAGFSKRVALKMLHARHKGTDTIVRRLKDEARILAMVRHRAIVQVDGLVELQGRWTIVMEYVAGATLKECIEATGPLPPKAALDIAAEVASALYEAYNTPGPDGRPLRLLHRDIKPSNIQVPATGALKILDFGIATADFERREADTTDHGFGSWDYVAPERLDGVDSPAGDVYSIGTLLFEALVGEPFGRASGNPVRHQQRLTEGMRRLEQSAAGRVPEVAELVRQLLAYDPEDRPPSRDVEKLARAAAEVAPGDPLAVWAAQTVPMVLERTPRMPLDRLSGTILEEGVEADEEEEDVTDAPSIAPAFGLPADITGELHPREPPSEAQSEPLSLPSERPPLTLTDLATRDLTPAGTPAGRAWAVISVVLLALVLITMGAMATVAFAPPPRPAVTIIRPPPPGPEPARSVLDPEESASGEAGEGEPGESEADEPVPHTVVRPVPVPVPVPVPPDPSELDVPRRLTGVVSVSGDHTSVTLIGDQGSFPPGRVPAGTYVVEATFPDRGPVVAGRITVESGRRLRLTCNAVFSRCEPR